MVDDELYDDKVRISNVQIINDFETLNVRVTFLCFAWKM